LSNFEFRQSLVGGIWAKRVQIMVQGLIAGGGILATRGGITVQLTHDLPFFAGLL
jgi:hypothetical protein